MRGAQEDAMMDTCVIVTRDVTGTNDYNRPVAQWLDSPAMACGYDDTVEKEAMAGTQVVLVDAVVRLSIDTDLSNLDRLRITHRHGEELDESLTFETLGDPERGPSGLVLNLQLVTDGSEE